MKYFIHEYEREGTAYICFRKGKWNGSPAWRHEKESMLIDVDELYLCGLQNVLDELIPNFDIYSTCNVTFEQWERIYDKAMAIGGETKLAVEELSEWAWENFERWEMFCIVGV